MNVVNDHKIMILTVFSNIQKINVMIGKFCESFRQIMHLMIQFDDNFKQIL